MIARIRRWFAPPSPKPDITPFVARMHDARRYSAEQTQASIEATRRIKQENIIERELLRGLPRGKGGRS